jgi:hypothetical protein
MRHHGSIKSLVVRGGWPGAPVGARHWLVSCCCNELTMEFDSFHKALAEFKCHIRFVTPIQWKEVIAMTEQPISPLVARLIESNAEALNATTNRLLDLKDRRYALAAAKLQLITTRIEDLVSGDYMPTSDALRRALHPHPAEINQLADEILAGEL